MQVLKLKEVYLFKIRLYIYFLKSQIKSMIKIIWKKAERKDQIIYLFMLRVISSLIFCY